MGRLHRFLLEGHCYHVTTGTREAAPLLQDLGNARAVVDALQFLRGDRAYLLGYAVLPDHFHALLVPRGQQTISKLMQSVKGYSARVVNASQGRSGALWQRSFYDRVMLDEAHLIDTLDYIQRNPVAAGLAGAPEEYPFSSAHPEAETDIEFFFGGSRGWKASATRVRTLWGHERSGAVPRGAREAGKAGQGAECTLRERQTRRSS